MSNQVTVGSSLTVSKFNKLAVLDATGVDNLGSSLNNSNFVDNLVKAFTSQSQYINSLRWYPFDLSNFMTVASEESNLTLGGHEAKWGGTVTYNTKCKLVDSDSVLRAVLVGVIDVDSYYGDFLDYEPYTTGQIYLPYLGFYALPLKDCMGKRLYVYYAVDFDTGMATAYVEVDDDYTVNDRVILTASGKIGIDIPIGQTNANEIAKSNFENSVKIVASGLAIGGGVYANRMAGKSVAGGLIAMKGVETAMSSGVNFVTSQQQHYSRGSMSGGRDMICSPTNIYIVLYRPKSIYDGNELLSYAKLKGRPCGNVYTLSELTGFTTVNEVHLEGFNHALSSELEEIESLLHQGVIL